MDNESFGIDFFFVLLSLFPYCLFIIFAGLAIRHDIHLYMQKFSLQKSFTDKKNDDIFIKSPSDPRINP